MKLSCPDTPRTSSPQDQGVEELVDVTEELSEVVIPVNSYLKPGDERLYITLRIRDLEVPTLIDTGFSGSLMFQACLFYELQQQGGVRLTPTTGHVTVADGNKAEIAGLCNPIVYVGSKRWKGKAILVKGLNYPAIMGVRMLNDLGAVIDTKNRTISINGDDPEEVAELLTLFEVASGEVAEDEDEWPEPPPDITVHEDVETSHRLVSPDELQEFNQFIKSSHVQFNKCSGPANVSPLRLYVDPHQPPVKMRSYPLSPAMQKVAKEEVEKMLAKGIIKESDSPWNSPAFLLRKKTGDWRFTVDFREVNKRCRRNSHPLPFINETLDQLRDSAFISTLDLEAGYHQCPLTADSQEVTAFSIVGLGHFEFTRVPFGLSTAPNHFQAEMERALKEAIAEGYVLLFLDDIVIVSKTFREHIVHLQRVLELLVAANLKLNWKKCHFLREQVEFLGHVVGSGKIQVSPKKCEAILNFPRPKTPKQLRGFLSLVSFCRRFIPGLADKSALLTAMLKKDAKIEWTDERNEAFLRLKQSLVEPPVLHMPDFSLPFEIRADASDYALGAILLQRDEDQYNVIAYHSKIFTAPERNYTTTEKECLAVLSACEKWKHYIMGQKTVVRTDHSSLTWLQNIKNPTGRLARWTTRLSVFDLEIMFLKGSENQLADCLSRAYGDVPFAVEGEAVSAASIQFADTTDHWYQKMCTNVEQNPKRFPNFLIKDKLLYKKVTRPGTKAMEWKLVVPTSERPKLLQQYHDSLYGAHLGVRKTYCKLAQDYYWPKMALECKKYVRGCADCQKHKAPNVKAAGEMTVRKTDEIRPNQIVTLDLMGPLPCTTNRNQFILVCVCAATKFLIAVPLKKATADNVLKAFQVFWVSFLGIPKILQTDNGSQLVSKKMQAYCTQMGIQLNHSPYYFPASNMCERYNRNIKTALAIFAKGNHRNWDQHLPFIQFALNSAVSETTGYSPNKLIFGREIDQPFSSDPALLGGSKTPFDPKAHVDQSNNELPKIYAKAVEATNRAKQSQQRQYNLRHRPVVFSKGDLVWKQTFEKSSAADYLTAKLMPKYNGPFRIKDVLSKTQYELEDLNGKIHGRWNVTHLKPLNEDTRL